MNQLPSRYQESWDRAANAGWYTFSGYARGTMLVAGSDALFAFLWLLALGIPLAAPLGILVLIGAFVPLFGAPTAMIVSMVVALASKGVYTAIFVGIGIAVIAQIEGHVLQPLIMGHQVSLHPVVVGVGVVAGTVSAGLLGAVIAIPIIAVFWAVYTELRSPLLGDRAGPDAVINDIDSEQTIIVPRRHISRSNYNYAVFFR